MLGFTALYGQPVMCLVIISGVQEKWEVETGIDIDIVPVGDLGDPNFFVMFPLGPECTFQTEEGPNYGEMVPIGFHHIHHLKGCPCPMDHHNLFERSNNRKPFILLGGHQSCFEIPSFEYVTNADHPMHQCTALHECLAGPNFERTERQL